MFKQTCTELKKLPKQRVRQWLNTIETVVFDCDGVMWHFGKALDGAVEAFNMLASSGRRILTVTNNSGLVRKSLAAKCVSLGFHIEERNIYSASMAICNFLLAKKLKKKVYVVGEDAICEDLKNMGICGFVVNNDKLDKPIQIWASELQLDPEVGAVVVAKDDNFTTMKIIRACSHLLDPKVLFLATCLDAAYNLGNQRMIVGAGANVAAVKVISGREPLILGKPNPWIINEPLKAGAIKPETTLMVGDTLATDIFLANNCGFQSLLVGTGANSLEQAREMLERREKKKMVLVPDTYLPKLGDLLEFLCES